MSGPTCINLAERFADRYRISHDEAAGTWKERQDPWMQTILCARGVIIYPHGDNVLAVECDYHGGIARRIAAIPGVRVHQQGGNLDPRSFDGETTFLFDVSLFGQVAEIVKPRRKRRLSEEQKAAAVERLAGYRFSPAAGAHLASATQG